LSYQETILKTAKSNGLKKSKPQIVIKNPLEKDIYINAINLVADIYFSLKGRCEIRINGNVEFSPENNAFKLRKEILIPLENQILQQGRSIEIYIWNETDDDIVELSAQIIISENKNNITISGQAVDDSTMLQGISGGAGDESDTHDIFPYQIYTDETKEFLINTKGRQNMLLTMASSNVYPPKIISNTFPPDPLGLHLLELLRNPSTLPDSTSGVSNEDYVDHVTGYTGRHCGKIYSTSHLREVKTHTDYLNDFDKILLQDGTELIDAILESFSDYYILIDGLNEINKQIKFDFDTSILSGIVEKELSYIKYKTKREIRERIIEEISRGSCGGFYYPSEWGEWHEDGIWINYIEKVIVTLRYELKYIVESSNTLDFAILTQIDEITELSGVRTYAITDRYIRIRRVIVGTSLSYSVDGTEQSSNEELEGEINYPIIEDVVTLSNFIDLLSHGGEASLHFELQGVNNQWFIILDSSQLGAVTQGESKLIQFNIAGIPPSQSRFKAVLEVTGSLKTGVTIDLVA